MFLKEIFNIFIFILLCLILFTNGYHNITLSIKSDPEIYMNVTEVINLYGYPCENHLVLTEDGYILSIQRIPHGLNDTTVQNRPVVFLQHGLIDSSFTWVNNAPDKSLAFILADKGFDVWLANSRGNVYSNKHIKYSPNSNKFWDFSWDEMTKYDLAASIDYVLTKTNSKKLTYIGHSQGTEIMFAKLFQDSSFNSKISSFVALAPVSYVGKIKTGIRYLAHAAGGMDIFLKLFNHGEFLPSSKFIKALANYVCEKELTVLCSNIFFLVAGYDTKNLNYSRIPIYMAHTPAGTSSRNMVHYAQGYESNEFQMYDHGYIGNLIIYHQLHPPKYELSTHGVPLAMFWGGNDWLADPDDVMRALKILGRNVTFNKFIPEYNHLDFIWGENAAKLIYPDLIDFIKRYIN